MDKISVNSTDLSAWRAGEHNLPYKIYGAKEPKIQGKGSNNKKGTIVDLDLLIISIECTFFYGLNKTDGIV